MALAGCGPAGLANTLTPSGGYKRTTDLAYGPLPRQRLDLYLPVAAFGPFLFGVGLTIMSPTTFYVIGIAWAARWNRRPACP